MVLCDELNTQIRQNEVYNIRMYISDSNRYRDFMNLNSLKPFNVCIFIDVHFHKINKVFILIILIYVNSL